MADDVTSTDKQKRKSPKRKPIDPAKLPPSTVFENWWEDPRCKAFCEIVARAIMREAAKDAPMILETAEPIPAPATRPARRTRPALTVIQ